MHKRFFATTVIALALLFGQIGTFVVAAFCPHLSSKVVSCETQAAPAESESANHGMHDMQMEATESLPNHAEGNVAIPTAEPTGSCKHCALHSRTSPNKTSLRESNIPQRSVDLTISLPVADVTLAPKFPAAVMPARAHGPPGNETPRHVLINIFRI